MVQVQNKVEKSLKYLECYAHRDWAMKTNNMREIYSRLNETDKTNFYSSNVHIDPDDYMTNSFLGVRQYYLKEPLSTISRARKNLNLCVFII